MSVTYSGDAATTRTNLGLGDAATKTIGTGAGNIPVLDSSGKLSLTDLNLTVTQVTKTASFTPVFAEGTIYSCTGTMTITMPTATVGESFTIFHSNAADITWAGAPKWNGGHAPGQAGQPALSGVAYFTFISDGVSWFGIQKGTAFEAARAFSEVSNNQSIESLQTDFGDGPYPTGYPELAHTPVSVAVNPYDLTKGFTVTAANTTGLESVYPDQNFTGSYDYKTINAIAGTSGVVGSLTDATKYAHDIPDTIYGRDGRAVIWSWGSQSPHYNLTDEIEIETKFNYSVDDGATWSEHTLAQDLVTYPVDNSSIFGAYFSDSNDELFVFYVRQMSTAAPVMYNITPTLDINTTTTNIYCDRFILSTTNNTCILQESTLVVPDTVPDMSHWNRRSTQRNVVAGYQDQILLFLPDIMDNNAGTDAEPWTYDYNGAMPASTIKAPNSGLDLTGKGTFFEAGIVDISGSAAPVMGGMFGNRSSNYTQSGNKVYALPTSPMSAVILYGDTLYWEYPSTTPYYGNPVTTGYTYAYSKIETELLMSNFSWPPTTGLTPKYIEPYNGTRTVIETPMSTPSGEGDARFLADGSNLLYALFSPVRSQNEDDYRNRNSMRFLPNWLETDKMLIAIDDTTINNYTEADKIKVWAIDFSDPNNISKILYHTFANDNEVPTMNAAVYVQDDALARPTSSIHANINYDDKVVVISSAYEISYQDNAVGYISVYKWD